MQSNLHNTNKAISFLRAFRKTGYHNIVSINPHTNDINAITRPASSEDLERFISTNNGKNNLYFSVNEPKPDAPDKKLTKNHIGKIHGVWLDADPDKKKPFQEERERLYAFAENLKNSKNQPTYIVDSGGGIQAFWLLKTAIEANEDRIRKYEALSRGLAKQYSTDAVQNIDRIMRIPFTLNIPNTAKIKAGRNLSPATIYWADSKTGVRYD